MPGSVMGQLDRPGRDRDGNGALHVSAEPAAGGVLAGRAPDSAGGDSLAAGDAGSLQSQLDRPGRNEDGERAVDEGHGGRPDGAQHALGSFQEAALAQVHHVPPARLPHGLGCQVSAHLRSHQTMLRAHRRDLPSALDTWRGPGCCAVPAGQVLGMRHPALPTGCHGSAMTCHVSNGCQWCTSSAHQTAQGLCSNSLVQRKHPSCCVQMGCKVPVACQDPLASTPGWPPP